MQLRRHGGCNGGGGCNGCCCCCGCGGDCNCGNNGNNNGNNGANNGNGNQQNGGGVLATTTTTTTRRRPPPPPPPPGRKKREVAETPTPRFRRLVTDEQLEASAKHYAFSFKGLSDLDVPPEMRSQRPGGAGAERLTQRLVSGLRVENPPNKISVKP
ncbi:hypothetical protein M3Y99_01888100 [Aphelenchoides fujianensis]|nr:hypothetical protein M3Y99_01888100 [Aphelenchoides fujianensis]